MTQQEFFYRTNVKVNEDEFWAINAMYNYCEVDKDEFCKMWCKMNPARVQAAKAQQKIEKKEAAYKNALQKWFDRWNKSQKFFDNYHTLLAYTKVSTFEIKAMSYIGINVSDSLSNIHFAVGQYLGIYRS